MVLSCSTMRCLTATTMMMLLVSVAASSSAVASPEPLVLTDGRLQFDFGLGLGHRGPPDRTGLGFNIEMKYGMGGGMELGFRTAVRNDNGPGVSADTYARPFDYETFGTGNDTFANPELRIRQAVNSALALEARAYIPFEGRFGFMLAAPLRLATGALALNSGVYVPIVFTSGATQSWVSIPAHLWFAIGASHVGILSGARLSNPGSDWKVPLGVGFARTLSQAADLLLWFLFEDITRDAAAKQFGAGIGLRFRI